MASVINGIPFNGNLTIRDGKILIDGKDVTPESKIITISIEGNVDKLQVDVCDKVYINGDVGEVRTASGDVYLNECKGNIQTTSGDVKCDGSCLEIKTTSGDVKATKVMGKITTVSGDVDKF